MTGDPKLPSNLTGSAGVPPARTPGVTTDPKLPSNHRKLNPELVALLKGLASGDKIKITQTVRVGAKTWPAVAVGAFRGVNYLATGVTVDRVAADDIVVPLVHFTKENGELASVSLDENTRVERV